MMEQQQSKRFLFVNRRAPYGSSYAMESLDAVLIGAAFDQDVSLLFIEDGVFLLKKGQDTSGLEIKNFSPAYAALEMYDVRKLYVSKACLNARGLGKQDLSVPVELLSDEQITALMEAQDVVFSF